MSGLMIVSLISLTACLVLALRNLRADGLAFETRAWMAVTWLLIIAVVAFVAGQFGA